MLSTQEIFINNLNLYKKKVPHVFYKIHAISNSEIQQCITEKNEDNLFIYGAYFYAPSGAVEETKQCLKKVALPEIDILYIWGTGLGYIYLELLPWLKENQERRLIFIDVEYIMVHHFLSQISSTEILRDNQVDFFFIEDLSSNKKALIKLVQRYSLLLPESIILPYYENKYGNTIKEARDFLMKICVLENYETQGTLLYNHLFFDNFFSNLSALSKSYDGTRCFKSFQDIPAVICGAGPSLNKQIPLLKKYSSHALLLSGGSANNILDYYGVRSHISLGLDNSLEEYQRFDLLNSFEIPFFYRLRLNHHALKTIHAPLCYLKGKGWVLFEEWYEKEIGLYQSGFSPDDGIDEGHSVGCMSINLAIALGCNPIILLGMDLAYTGDKEYAAGIEEDPIILENLLQKEEKQWSGSVEVKDIFGKSIYSKWRWLIEQDYISRLVEEFPEITFINATEGGIGIPGIENISFEKVTKKYFSRVYDLENRVHHEIQHASLLSTDPKNIKYSIQKISLELERLMELYDVLADEGVKVIDEILEEKKDIQDWKDRCPPLLLLSKIENSFIYKPLISLIDKEYFRVFQKQEEIITNSVSILKTIELDVRKFVFIKNYIYNILFIIDKIEID